MINHVNTAAPQVPQVNVNVGGAAAPATASGAVGTVAQSVGQQLGTVNVNVSVGTQSQGRHAGGSSGASGSGAGGALHYRDPVWKKLMGGEDSGSCSSHSGGHCSDRGGLDFDDPCTYEPREFSKCELNKMKVVDPDGEGKCNPDTADRYDPETGAIYKSVKDDCGNTRWMVSGKAEPGQWCYDGSKEDLDGIVYFDDETHRPEGEGSGSGCGSHGDHGDYGNEDSNGCGSGAGFDRGSNWGAGETGHAHGPRRPRAHGSQHGGHLGGDVNITINLNQAGGDAATVPAPAATPVVQAS